MLLAALIIIIIIIIIQLNIENVFLENNSWWPTLMNMIWNLDIIKSTH